MSTPRIVITLVFIALVGYVAATTTDILRFTPFTAGEFVQLFTPLFLAALFIERAVEVFILQLPGLGERASQRRAAGR